MFNGVDCAKFGVGIIFLKIKSREFCYQLSRLGILPIKIEGFSAYNPGRYMPNFTSLLNKTLSPLTVEAVAFVFEYTSYSILYYIYWPQRASGSQCPLY